MRGGGEGVTKLAQRHIPARHKRTCWSLFLKYEYMLYDDEVSFHTGLYIFLIVGYVALIFVLPGDV